MHSIEFIYYIKKNITAMTHAYHSDRLLWCAFQEGDRRALDILFRSYYPLLYQYGVKIVTDHNQVEECLQDFFLYLYEKRQSLSIPDKIKPYLFISFRRHLLRQKDKATREMKVLKLSTQWQTDISFSEDELIISKESDQIRKKILHEMINRLPARQREVIFLRYFSDLSINEIAEALSISYQGTVNTLYKAIKSLRKDLRLKEIKAILSLLLFILFSYL